MEGAEGAEERLGVERSVASAVVHVFVSGLLQDAWCVRRDAQLRGSKMRPASRDMPVNGAKCSMPPSPNQSSRGSTPPSPPRQDLLASVHGLHQHGIFDAKQKLWTRSLALRRGGTVVVAEDYATDDPTADGQWCALDSINALLHTPAT